jgi:hypothetical protein
MKRVCQGVWRPLAAKTCASAFRRRAVWQPWAPVQYDRFGFGRQGDPGRLGDDLTPGALPERPLWTDTLANC